MADVAPPNKPKSSSGILTGAAFLMAVSAIGPGFLTQTTQFTVQLEATLAFAILVSILVDIGAQLNTWRVVCVSGKRGHEVANAVLPGLGGVVTAVIVAGSFIFNLGNLSGCAQGLDVLFGLPRDWGAILSALIAVVLFLLPSMLSGMDWFSKVLGAGMILMTLYIVYQTVPPVGEAALRAVAPARLDYPAISAITTLIGGTIGGYIMFSGAHRLLDGGVTGPNRVAAISWASVQGIIITGTMRIVVFLAVLGVVAVTSLDVTSDTIVFDAFDAGGGHFGYVLSGLVFWSAAITSVVGCSYTSISFLHQGENPRHKGYWIVAFITLSLLVTLGLFWQGIEAKPLLIAAGMINGVLMPVVLGVVLVAAYRRSMMGVYRHPWWAGAFGLIAWAVSLVLAVLTVYDNLPKLF